MRLQKEDVFFLCKISERIQLETLPAFADLDLHIPPCLAPEQCRPMAGGLSEPGMPGVTWHPQILTDQLTLSQPEGQIIPPILLHYYPQIFKPSDIPEAYDEQEAVKILLGTIG